MYKGNKYRLVRSFTRNVKSIYGLENQFPNNKFMDNTIQFVHKTWGGVWVVIAISSLWMFSEAQVEENIALECVRTVAENMAVKFYSCTDGSELQMITKECQFMQRKKQFSIPGWGLS